MNIVKEKLTTFYQLQIILISIFKWIKKLFYNFFTSSFIMFSILSLSKCITCFSSLSMEEIKLFDIANWIFHVSDFLRLFMIPFKYGLILKRYFSTDTVLFLSPLPSYTIEMLLQNVLALTGL